MLGDLVAVAQAELFEPARTRTKAVRNRKIVSLSVDQVFGTIGRLHLRVEFSDALVVHPEMVRARVLFFAHFKHERLESLRKVLGKAFELFGRPIESAKEQHVLSMPGPYFK